MNDFIYSRQENASAKVDSMDHFVSDVVQSVSTARLASKSVSVTKASCVIQLVACVSRNVVPVTPATSVKRVSFRFFLLTWFLKAQGIVISQHLCASYG